METIYIKRQTKPKAPGESVYVAPAVGIKAREGLRLIPHPYGTETIAFNDLDTAIAQIHRAGYAAEFEGKHHPLPTAPLAQKPRVRPRSLGATPAMRTIEDAIPYLHEQLNDNNPNVVANAAYALGELKDEGALPGLIHSLSNEDAGVRKNVAEALAKIGRPALNAIQLALKDKNWVVRHTALTAVLELLHEGVDLVPDVLPDALPLLKDESWLVRSQAATVFGEAARIFQEQQDREFLSGGSDKSFNP
jgi:hypothetical protein